jgi:hypothetical protein
MVEQLVQEGSEFDFNFLDQTVLSFGQPNHGPDVNFLGDALNRFCMRTDVFEYAHLILASDCSIPTKYLTLISCCHCIPFRWPSLSVEFQ